VRTRAARSHLLPGVRLRALASKRSAPVCLRTLAAPHLISQAQAPLTLLPSCAGREPEAARSRVGRDRGEHRGHAAPARGGRRRVLPRGRHPRAYEAGGAAAQGHRAVSLWQGAPALLRRAWWELGLSVLRFQLQPYTSTGCMRGYFAASLRFGYGPCRASCARAADEGSSAIYRQHNATQHLLSCAFGAQREAALCRKGPRSIKSSFDNFMQTYQLLHSCPMSACASSVSLFKTSCL
jgi:hypothetical protein